MGGCFTPERRGEGKGDEGERVKREIQEEREEEREEERGRGREEEREKERDGERGRKRRRGGWRVIQRVRDGCEVGVWQEYMLQVHICNILLLHVVCLTNNGISIG